MMDKGWEFLVFWSSSWGDHPFSPSCPLSSLRWCAVKAKGVTAITSVYWVLLTVILIWECLWWVVLKQMEDWTHGEHGPRPSVSLLPGRICSLSHLTVTWGSEPPPWVAVRPELVRPRCWPATCQGAEDMLRYMSCVLPLDCFTWSSILGKLGQLQFSHFLVPKQKGALLHGEEGAGDAWGTLRVFHSTAVAVFIGGPLKRRALRYLQVL